MNLPKVSVVIAAGRDRPLYVESLKAQDYPNYEIVPVSGYAAAAARNKGVRNTFGDIVAFIDDDDVWLPKKLEMQLAFMEARPEIGLSYTPFQIFRNSGGKLEPTKRFPVVLGSKFEEILGMFIVTSTVIIRKDHLNSIELFNPEYPVCGDLEFWLRFVQRWKIAAIDEVLCLTVMDERDHGGKDQMAVCKDAVRVFQGLELLPELKQCRRHVSHYIARGNYRIARMYVDEGDYWQAAKHFMSAILADPLVGLAFKQPEEQGLNLVLRVFKSYLAVPICLFWRLVHGRR